MNISLSGIKFTEACEGYRGIPYKDLAGYWTWGFGHKQRKGEPLPAFVSIAQAQILLTNDMKVAEVCINDNVKRPLTQPQFDALCDFVFNLGSEAFVSSTLLRLLNDGMYLQAADQFLVWDKAHTPSGALVEVPGLYVRRMHERMMFMGDAYAT